MNPSWNLKEKKTDGSKKIDHKLTVCKVTDVSNINLDAEFYFIGKTDEEISLVCKTEDTPQNTIERDDGWRGFRNYTAGRHGGNRYF